MTRAELVVVVMGTPAPQGSKRHVGGGRMVEQSPNLAPWRAVVTQEAVRIMLGRRIGGMAWQPDPRAPITLAATFTIARPASHYRTGRHAALLRDSAPQAPVARPDIDKLLRSTLDALVDAGAMSDDSRVTRVTAEKVYPGGALDALDSPGAVLTLWES
jgi:Holliday junction resolvase RusA-like endonuclease